MSKRLPPLNTLWVFLTASRLLSFTKAADELFITRSAVSRQIKNLEEYFGFKLFERHKVGLELTEQGVIYANSISNVFADLKVATDTVHHGSENRKLKLGISATVNSTWLMSRLCRLEQHHPELTLSFFTNSFDTGKDSIDFSGENMNAAIRLGTEEQWQGCHFDKLIDVYVQPVCSPSLLDESHNPEDILDLANYNWLHYGHLSKLWAQWLSNSRYPALQTDKKNIVLDNVAVATQAAVDGLGIIPMYRPLADPLIKEGKLVVAHNYMMLKKESYYFVCPENYKDNQTLKIFRDWLVNESEQAQQQWDKEFLD
ncbi:LysR substrate-binding domain-containing protein [Aliiglaciecola sp. 3_MG-2023]|uniref:LysR substrate-binding domain-containing protein n=1 Tax=Aliiglaciecola sp. 3_MG-2023 TaxID=3062644 RepID=UPI0026E162A9|nr:LysR substrate-binding domain-containing protein [Aliiglaciecola sp. 3_MG-2023]MDO6694656.1 LysR substrate-binding domain-containing protein [Aliiglaciecola sp. 3_MG-2023]